MNDPIRNDLHLIRQRIEYLHTMREHDKTFQEGLNFAVSGIEQALGAVGGDPIGNTHLADAIDGIENSLAELHIRLETNSEAWKDDPFQGARLAMAEHLLAQACMLLAD